MPTPTQIAATILFALAIIHTFSVSFFARLANRGGAHSGLFQLLSEVEVVFGVWACALFVWMSLRLGFDGAIDYLTSRDFTEPAFVFAIMVVAASRPIIALVHRAVNLTAVALPIELSLARFFIIMTLVPLSGSFITEPAAMTLAALLLKDGYFKGSDHERFKYLTIGVLFVNVSIGGVLTAYAAPPVLMVAHTFGWDTLFMLEHFGWHAVIAVLINTTALTLICKDHIAHAGDKAKREDKTVVVPWSVIAIHVGFLIAVVLSSHHIQVFLALLVLFIGYASAYHRHQSPLLIREAFLVGFFLAGLVVLGGLQKWWLQDLLAGLSPYVLYVGATLLTAITDNAALTYLGSLVEGTGEIWRYMLVAGAVTGGGLTVIANAPNPAGFSILKGSFKDKTITPLGLLLSALAPTGVTAAVFIIPELF